MKYTPKEVMDYIQEEDIKFVRLAFCDVYGRQRNIAIMANELPRAFQYGIAIDGSAIDGFGMDVRSDLFLHPDPGTLSQLPWRPQRGGVAHMFCDITTPDGTPFDGDTRTLLKQAVQEAEEAGVSFRIGSEIEFYLFKQDENGDPTLTPIDNAGYMDIASEDKGENVRREICLTLEQMGIHPEASHHESGPGQNEIDFRYADPLAAADNAVTFKAVVQTIASQYALHADFSPRPLINRDGSGMHINLSADAPSVEDTIPPMVAGILSHIRDITLFLNPVDNSYTRLGCDKAPGFVTWSHENRSQLIRIPAAWDEYRRLELRSADPAANPYLAFALIIRAALDGIRSGMTPPPPTDAEMPENAPALPRTMEAAVAAAKNSDFVRNNVPERILRAYSYRTGAQFFEP